MKASQSRLIPGHATPEGTARYRDRFANQRPSHFRNTRGLWLSSIGLGTYLGEATPEVDALYRDAATRALEMGTNVIDTAVNYRHQRSERAIGEALTAMIALGSVRRDEVFLATKGGFLTFDGKEPDDPAAYFEDNLVRTGLIEPNEVAANCHVMAPRYIENQVDVSRRNLGVETIDLYYVHNPETQLRAVSRPEFYRRLTAAFAALERAGSRRQDPRLRCGYVGRPPRGAILARLGQPRRSVPCRRERRRPATSLSGHPASFQFGHAGSAHRQDPAAAGRPGARFARRAHLRHHRLCQRQHPPGPAFARDAP